jgi:hypothetical protein
MLRAAKACSALARRWVYGLLGEDDDPLAAGMSVTGWTASLQIGCDNDHLGTLMPYGVPSTPSS